jgi:two-component system, NtrC family, sensor kinase
MIESVERRVAPGMTLKRGLLLGLAAVLLVALVPAGFWLDRTVARALEARAREDLALAPTRLQDRNAARGDALMMHAKEAASVPAVRRALEAGNGDAAARELLAAGVPVGEVPVLVGADGAALAGPQPDTSLIAAARRGEMPVGFIAAADQLWAVSIAPVLQDGRFLGAAGVAMPMDETTAAALSVLTAADVTLVTAAGAIVASTLEPGEAAGVVGQWRRVAHETTVRELRTTDSRWWLIDSPLGGVGAAIFSVDADDELALLTHLRRGAVAAGLLALLLAGMLGLLLAERVARPVTALARAADRLSRGDFDAPLPGSRLREVERVRRAFADMRAALASRLRELSTANAQLAEGKARLQALQSEMIQRDRLTAAGRLVTELAHEIRNPVANVRNCLEVIRRRSPADAETRRFADLAIDELLRMHELAEQMLDLNRPLDPGATRCDVGDVVQRTVALLASGTPGERWPARLHGQASAQAAMPPDVLKQVLLSIVQNAREAIPDGGPIDVTLTQFQDVVIIDVEDEGPGLAEDVLPRIFDPFFTTKGDVRGVGLGLFIAEGLVRRSGGRIHAENRAAQRGARFRIELPVAGPTAAERARHVLHGAREDTE